MARRSRRPGSRAQGALADGFDGVQLQVLQVQHQLDPAVGAGPQGSNQQVLPVQDGGAAPRPPHPQYFAQAQAIRAGTNRLLPLETTATDVTPGQTTTPTIRNLQQRNNDAPTAKLLAQATPNKASATFTLQPQSQSMITVCGRVMRKG